MTDRDALRARAMAAPARRWILSLLASADDAMTVAALTAELGLNHNAVRKHLDRLAAAGLVTETRETRSTRGRPRLLYRLAAESPAGEERAYRRLATMLATVLATGDDPVAVGRRSAVPVAPATGVDGLAARFAADGFAPTVRRRGDRTEIVLDACPFADAAEANPDVVCGLHLGLAQGAAAGTDVSVESLSPRPPRRAGCRLAVSEA